MRCPTLFIRGDELMRLESRSSGTNSASRSAKPSHRSPCDSSMTPPFELRRWPSNAAMTFLRSTAGNPNGNKSSSVVDGRGAL
jgi:hypothetical protein